MSRHYTPESFLYLSATAGRALFLDMTTALQPLGQLPLRLEYQLEYQALQQLEQKRLSDYLLDKHVANAEHAYVESQQALANAANMNNADTKAAAQSQVCLWGYCWDEKSCCCPLFSSVFFNVGKSLILSIV